MFDKVDKFIREYDGTNIYYYLVLKIIMPFTIRMRYLIGLKGDIAYMFFLIIMRSA